MITVPKFVILSTVSRITLSINRRDEHRPPPQTVMPTGESVLLLAISMLAVVSVIIMIYSSRGDGTPTASQFAMQQGLSPPLPTPLSLTAACIGHTDSLIVTKQQVTTEADRVPEGEHTRTDSRKQKASQMEKSRDAARATARLRGLTFIQEPISTREARLATQVKYGWGRKEGGRK